MGYSVNLDPDAAEDLKRLPSQLQARIQEKIEALASSPSRSQSRSTPALYPPGQLFEAQIGYDEMTALVDVVFQYSADEQSLYIKRILVEFI